MINRILVGLAIGGGIGAGAAGLALGYSGNGPFASAPSASVPAAGAVHYYLCPGEGDLGRLASGDRVYLTGTDESGDWVQLRAPGAAADRAWIERDHVDPDRDVDLPLASCSTEIAEFERADGTTTTTSTLPLEEPGEGEEPTTTTESPTTSTTRPSTTTTRPTPTTTSTTRPPSTTSTTRPSTTTSSTTTSTTAPPAVAPSFGPVARSAASIKEDFGDSCPGHPNTTSLITTSVAHPSGSVTVQFRWRLAGGAWSQWQTVSNNPGQASGQIGPFAPDTLPVNGAAEVSWEFRASSDNGPTRTRSSSPNERVTLNWCSLF